MLPANNPLRFRKNLFDSYKMTLTDELKILDDKIKANQAQYDLGREAAKISALSSKDLLEKIFEKNYLSILHWVRFWLITLKRKRIQIR